MHKRLRDDSFSSPLACEEKKEENTTLLIFINCKEEQKKIKERLFALHL